MNIGSIFVCLLIGAIIGFEAGKYVMGRKVSEMISAFADQLKNAAEDIKKKAQEEEEIKKERAETLRRLLIDVMPKAKDKEQFARDMGVAEYKEEIKELENNGEKSETDQTAG